MLRTVQLHRRSTDTRFRLLVRFFSVDLNRRLFTWPLSAFIYSTRLLLHVSVTCRYKLSAYCAKLTWAFHLSMMVRIGWTRLFDMSVSRVSCTRRLHVSITRISYTSAF